MPPTPERGGEGENRSAIGWCPCIWFCGSRVSPIRLLLSVYFRFRVSAITEAPKNNQSVYVADRPANKTAPRSATDASSPTPCGVQPHGRGSGSKHVDALRDSVRSWRRSAQKSRPSSKKRKGNDAKRHLPPGSPVPGHDTSDGKRAKLQNCKDAPETEDICHRGGAEENRCRSVAR